ncbi:MAG: hypothetical protein KKI08_21435 [Armatimonadetes bacterium]|nr:hypothetical protein [Armatimonadota bacterium]
MDFTRSAITRRQVLFVKGLLVWLVLSTTVIFALNAEQRVSRAVIGMGCGLIVLWVFLCGGLMVRFREAIARGMRAVPLPASLKFVLFATALALLEEAVTVSMTNLAPLFGVRVGEAYITASANYLDVVLHHSVIVFVPLFIGWALLLSKLEFTAFHVFLLFGITGTLAEASFSGPQGLVGFGLWIPVYGLMVWLPALAMPAPRRPWPLRWWMFPLAVVAPFLLEAPWALLMGLLMTPHPKIHFPPLG